MTRLVSPFALPAPPGLPVLPLGALEIPHVPHVALENTPVWGPLPACSRPQIAQWGRTLCPLLPASPVLLGGGVHPLGSLPPNSAPNVGQAATIPRLAPPPLPPAWPARLGGGVEPLGVPHWRAASLVPPGLMGPPWGPPLPFSAPCVTPGKPTQARAPMPPLPASPAPLVNSPQTRALASAPCALRAPTTLPLGLPWRVRACCAPRGPPRGLMPSPPAACPAGFAPVARTGPTRGACAYPAQRGVPVAGWGPPPC